MANIKAKQDTSVKWFQNMITNFASNSGFLKQHNIGKIVTRPGVGRLNFFFYDPKLKAILPYWDKFPLVLPLNYYADGFLGLNMHYLPPGARLAFFDDLMLRQSKKGIYDKLKKEIFGASYDTSQRIVIDYVALRDNSKYSPFKDCIKRYLYSHMKSPFLDIEPTYWAEVITLPVQQFQKGNPYGASASASVSDGHSRIATVASEAAGGHTRSTEK